MRLAAWTWMPCVAALAIFGCGGSAPAATGPELDRSDLHAWDGTRTRQTDANDERSGVREGPAGAGATDRARHAAPIELAQSGRFEALIALTVVRVRSKDARQDGSPHCSVYVLQATPQGLAEGRRSIRCPDDDGLGEVRASRVSVEPVDESRRRRLQGVLTGARASWPHGGEPPEANAPDRVDYAVTVRLRTDQGTVKGRVPPPAWPPPGAEQPPKALDRPPRGLAELWEAVMYPRRYARADGG